MARRMISAKSGREQHFDDIVARLGFEPWWMPYDVSQPSAVGVSFWPVSTVRGAATSRQLLGVNRTYRGHRGIDAVDPECSLTSRLRCSAARRSASSYHIFPLAELCSRGEPLFTRAASSSAVDGSKILQYVFMRCSWSRPTHDSVRPSPAYRRRRDRPDGTARTKEIP